MLTIIVTLHSRITVEVALLIRYLNYIVALQVSKQSMQTFPDWQLSGYYSIDSLRRRMQSMRFSMAH